MRVVVTGGSGNIGSAVLRALTEDGRHHVVGIARRRPTVPMGADPSAVSWHTADVGRDPLDPFLTGADAIVHLAWMFQPTHRPQVTWQANAVGTRNVLDAAARQGVPKFVCASSVAAYSPVDHDEPVDEGWETDGASPAAYCREKAYVERALDVFEANAPDTHVVRIRPAFVFQRSAASEQRRIFGGALLRPGLLRPGRLPLVPVPAGLRMQAVHAGDIARAVVAAVERPVRGPFNLAAADVLRRRELGEILEARTVDVPPALVRGALTAGWHARLAPVPGSLAAALLSVPVLATDRARTELGWEPRHSAADAVRAMLEGAAMRAGSQMPPLHP